MRLSRCWAKLPIELLLTSSCILPQAVAITFQSAPSPNLDISDLGSVGLAGNFDSISLYNYIGQNEDGLTSNGSQSILGRFPDGGFAELARADGAIMDMCLFQNQLVVGGNFTSLAGVPATGAALFDPNTKKVTALPGLNGQINALYCEPNTVYFGGQFQGGNSTNAISWVTNWTNLPFAGFNGPVNAIKALRNGHIVYGGSFTGIGNGSAAKPVTPDAQVVNVGSATVSSYQDSTTHPEAADPRNIICRTDSSSGTDWLITDGQSGYWGATFGFSFVPTKLRLLNSQTPGYSTANWRYTFYPTSGIANFSYYDREGTQKYCDRDCPLADNSTYQDFYFVNPIEMYGIRIDISPGSLNVGAGLGGIELFQDQIYSYAINEFNEPQCDAISTGSQSTVNPPNRWTRFNPPDNSTNFLTSYFPAGTPVDDDISVVFAPDLKQSGNYSIQVWTPGCIQDNSCNTRGQVNITGQVTSGSSGRNSNVTKTIVQKNYYDKYDELYYGYVDASSGSFKPSVTLTPTSGQSGPLTVVASRVGFVLRNSSSSNLNALYEYDPTQVNAVSDNSSAINRAGASLDEGANVLGLAIVGDSTYAVGNFSSSTFANVLVVENGNATSLPGGGLNEAVQALYQDGDQPGATLYMGGNFTNTRNTNTPGLNNLASYSTSDRRWHALGAGVNGIVHDIVPLQINISSTEQQPAIAFSGYFTQILPFDNYPAIPAGNLAVWVPSRNNWLQNIGTSNGALIGHLSSQTGTGSNQVFGGNVDSQTLQVTGVAGLLNSASAFNLQQLPIRIQPQQTSPQNGLQRRASTQNPVAGVVTGYFAGGPGLNITILGGHFTTRASNGTTIENLALIDVTKNNQVNGLVGNGSADAAILALEVSGTTLYAGGSIPNGFVEYNLLEGAPTPTQPPSLNGGRAVVEAIAARPSSTNTVFFGGSFDFAGRLGCAALCIYDTTAHSWSQPPQSIGDSSVINAMAWASPDLLYIAGNLTIQNNRTTLAAYDARAQAYHLLTGSEQPQNVPGPITAFTAMDSSYRSFFAAGVAANGSAFVTKFTATAPSFPNPPDGTWTPVFSSQQFNPATVIEGIQMMSASNEHARSPLIDEGQMLMITGLLDIQGFGNASAAIFNGTTLAPFALTTMQDGTPGSLRRTFVQNPDALLRQTRSKHLALGFVVLIALAIALALIFLIVVAGILAERYRRRREGYVPAPTTIPSYEKRSGNLGNISPERLFNGVRNGS